MGGLDDGPGLPTTMPRLFSKQQKSEFKKFQTTKNRPARRFFVVFFSNPLFQLFKKKEQENRARLLLFDTSVVFLYVFPGNIKSRQTLEMMRSSYGYGINKPRNRSCWAGHSSFGPLTKIVGKQTKQNKETQSEIANPRHFEPILQN